MPCHIIYHMPYHNHIIYAIDEKKATFKRLKMGTEKEWLKRWEVETRCVRKESQRGQYHKNVLRNKDVWTWVVQVLRIQTGWIWTKVPSVWQHEVRWFKYCQSSLATLKESYTTWARLALWQRDRLGTKGPYRDLWMCTGSALRDGNTSFQTRFQFEVFSSTLNTWGRWIKGKAGPKKRALHFCLEPYSIGPPQKSAPTTQSALKAELSACSAFFNTHMLAKRAWSEVKVTLEICKNLRIWHYSSILSKQ